jgi:hypothetical protein
MFLSTSTAEPVPRSVLILDESAGAAAGPCCAGIDSAARTSVAIIGGALDSLVPCRHFKDEIFKPYMSKAQRMDLGLSICRLIMSAHHGRIWATLGEPCGLVARPYLPVDVRET